jgi:ferritin
MDQKMSDALNAHLNVEFYSAHYYLAMSAYYHSIDLNGFAGWMRAQAQEELVHAMKFFDFINSREGRILLADIKVPPTSWEGPSAAFGDALKHEQEVTEKIYRLVDLALEKRDHATSNFLQWFVTEQVEEEATAKQIVQQLKLVGGDGNGLFLMDRELGRRSGEAETEPGPAE